MQCASILCLLVICFTRGEKWGRTGSLGSKVHRGTCLACHLQSKEADILTFVMFFYFVIVVYIFFEFVILYCREVALGV